MSITSLYVVLASQRLTPSGFSLIVRHFLTG